MDNLTKALLSICTQLASKEGITDEEALTVRANQIFNDAILAEPLTDAGKEAIEQAKAVVAVDATSTVSPYVTQPKFDYKKLRNETSIPAIVGILKKLSEYADFLPIPSETTPEYEQSCEDAYNKLTLSTFEVLNTNKIGMAEYKYVFDSLRAVIAALEEQVMQQVIGHRHEIMSRQFGAKNPGTGKFDAKYATYADLLTTRERVKKETGDNDADFFYPAGTVTE